MARAVPGFDAGAFRTGIRTAMRMGLPLEEDRWPEFVFEAATVANPATDAYGVPWDPNAQSEVVAPRSVRPLCALETDASSDQEDTFGVLQPGTIRVTLLDEEYAQVKGFAYVNLWLAGQETPARYRYNRVLQQPNLDVVGVWVLECKTEDEA